MQKKKPKDRHPDKSSDANRDKQINFVPQENNKQDKADAPAKGKLAVTEDDEELKEKIKQKIRDENEPEE